MADYSEEYRARAMSDMLHGDGGGNARHDTDSQDGARGQRRAGHAGPLLRRARGRGTSRPRRGRARGSCSTFSRRRPPPSTCWCWTRGSGRAARLRVLQAVRQPAPDVPVVRVRRFVSAARARCASCTSWASAASSTSMSRCSASCRRSRPCCSRTASTGAPARASTSASPSRSRPTPRSYRHSPSTSAAAAWPCAARFALAAGTQVGVRFRLPRSSRDIEVAARVVWNRTAQAGARPAVRNRGGRRSARHRRVRRAARRRPRCAELSRPPAARHPSGAASDLRAKIPPRIETRFRPAVCVFERLNLPGRPGRGPPKQGNRPNNRQW